MNELNLKDKVAVITGGAGIICSEMARALASQGVITVLIGRTLSKLENVAIDIEKRFGVTSLGISANVMDRISLDNAKRIINEKFGPIDILINGAGGNSSKATTRVEQGRNTKYHLDICSTRRSAGAGKGILYGSSKTVIAGRLLQIINYR